MVALCCLFWFVVCGFYFTGGCARRGSIVAFGSQFLFRATFSVYFLDLFVVHFSEHSVCSYRVPGISTASFYMGSSWPFVPGHVSVVYFSHNNERLAGLFGVSHSSSYSAPQPVSSWSLPGASRDDDSFPSRSVLDNSSVRVSFFYSRFFLGCVGVSFSVRHRT